MQKVACLFSFSESNWVSCQKIVFNLLRAYEEASGLELLKFNFSAHDRYQDLSELAQSVFEAAPQVISILDHKPHPLELFRELVPLYQGRPKPKLVIHVFGDFSLNFEEWEKTGEVLKGFPVEFVVASPRQKILIDRFLQHPCRVIPFPVNENEFSYRPELRAYQRLGWNLRDEDFAFVFTGRLSRQKRIKTLLETFSKEFAHEEKAHLFLYGSPDHMSDPFLGKFELEGEYFREFHKFYKSLPEGLQKRIHFMGEVPNKDLLKVYHGADAFINFSVHNDEDFGMSVAESQFSGLATILTDWGGLAGFEYPEIKEATHFIPVKFGRRSKLIVKEVARAGMRDFFLNSREGLRGKISQAAKDKFGLKASAERVQRLLDSEFPVFPGFSPFLQEMTEKMAFFPQHTPYINDKGEISGLYKDLYSAYVRTS